MRNNLVKFFCGLIGVFCSGVSLAATATPSRIVSLSLASDEVLLDLLPECGGLERLVAVSTFADDPQSSSVVVKAKMIKHRVHSEPEAVLSLKPDLVIAASFNRPELIELLRKRHVAVVVLQHFSSADDIADHVKAIAEAAHCDAAGIRMVQSFRDKLAAIPKAAKGLKVMNWSPDLTVMAGGTLFDAMVSGCGHQNPATTAQLKNWPRVSDETLRTWKPDVVVASCDGPDCAAIRQKIKNHTTWKSLPAVQQNRIVTIPSRLLLTTSQYFADANALLCVEIAR